MAAAAVLLAPRSIGAVRVSARLCRPRACRLSGGLSGVALVVAALVVLVALLVVSLVSPLFVSLVSPLLGSLVSPLLGSLVSPMLGPMVVPVFGSPLGHRRGGP